MWQHDTLGSALKRNEDFRMLTGQALHVDDVDFPNMLHVAFYRSGYAHGYIKEIDVSAVKEYPGVVAVLHCRGFGRLLAAWTVISSTPANHRAENL